MRPPDQEAIGLDLPRVNARTESLRWRPEQSVDCFLPLVPMDCRGGQAWAGDATVRIAFQALCQVPRVKHREEGRGWGSVLQCLPGQSPAPLKKEVKGPEMISLDQR